MREKTIVAVTETEFARGREAFEAAGATGLACCAVAEEESALAAAIRACGAAHAIIGVRPYAGALYDALPAGAVLARFGVGYDGVDLARATQRGLLCTNTPGVLNQSVAEHTLALILSAVRRIGRNRGWDQTLGTELAGKTLAVIGCGGIGCRVALIASRGFGLRVVGCKRDLSQAARLQAEFGYAAVTADFCEAVAGADFVSLHIPASPANRGFLNAERLAMLRREAWLVNTARGAVVDEEALFDALQRGRLRGAALDVFCREPYEPVVPGKDFRLLDNVVLTSHVGSGTVEAARRIGERALQNIRLAMRREFGAMDLLNREVLAACR
jgi:phosphoglycerate dehydrogenase-like enzyme